MDEVVARVLMRQLLQLVEGKCPVCGSDDLHSAAIGGEGIIECNACQWGTTYARLRADVENAR